MSHQNQINAQANTQNAAHLAQLTPDVVKKLTEKLSELMGEDLTGDFEQVRNERGEFLNEEGLPIIEISEPVEASATDEGETVVEESPLPSLFSLPDSVRKRLRQQRNSLLDQLEGEERLQERDEELADVEARQEILRKRKEAAAKEKEKLNAAKEMQKKMGKVLLQNLAKERAEDEEARAADAISDNVKRSSGDKKGKKTVSFADRYDEGDNSEDAQQIVDWGDITPARLRSTGRPSLLSPSDKLPMKMTVVEKFPSAPPKPTTTQPPDSDDESDPESTIDANEDSDLDSEATLEEDELDLEFAQHQREIALQYHEKRDKIGAAALAAMSAHSHDGDGDVQVDPSLDVPTSEPEKPSISRFKATRLASSYAASSPSTSMGASIIPASTARTIQKAVRTGKLDADERLVGGEADSASEDEIEGAQELLELLKNGEVYNIGPDGNYLHVIPPSAGTDKPATVTIPAPPASASSPIPDSLPPIDRPKASKFKLSRATGRPLRSSDQSSQNDTPVSVAERSSPKIPSPAANSVLEKIHPRPATAMNPTVAERPPSKPASVLTPTGSERRPAPINPALSTTLPSTIVNFPSFPAPAAHVSAADVASPFPMIVESPDFAKPAVPRKESRPLRPPTVMSSAVRETSSGERSSAPPQTKTGKVSRFMAERS
ncbi:hypothetical protein C0991_004889 [Blastosporella zonata]|nr:hypothetical protein C0991_004889 [Blastosporella zonata]